MAAAGSIVEVRGGRLMFEGVDVATLADRVPTPFFLFSPRQVRWNVETLRNAFSRRHLDTELFYASTACHNIWFLRQVHATGINVAVRSGGELQRALLAGFRPDQIVFNGGAKTRHEVRDAVVAGIRAVIADSLYELERIADVAAGVGTPAAVALRVDVDVPTRAHLGMATARGGKAGLDPADAVQGATYAAAQQCAGRARPALSYRLPDHRRVLVRACRGRDARSPGGGRARPSATTSSSWTSAGASRCHTGRKPPAPVRDVADCFSSTVQPDDYAAAICDTLRRAAA